MPADFVHLHVHSEYSLLDGLPKIDKLVSAVKDLGMSAVALTDHGVMYGAVEFYKEGQRQKIKPIIGMEAYVTARDHREKTGKGENFHLTLLAKDSTGYKNLMQLTTIAHLEGFYYKPRFSRELLQQYRQGLICLSGCGKGELAQAVFQGNFDSAKQIALWFLDVFQDDYYLEIKRHQFADFISSAPDPKIKDRLSQLQQDENTLNQNLVSLSRDLGIKLVATNDVHYLDSDDATAQDALVCISTGKKVVETERLRYLDAPTLYLRSPEEMSGLFLDLPDAVSNTLTIAAKCDVQIDLGQWFFPNIDIPSGITPEDHLTQLSASGLRHRYPTVTSSLQDRFNFELGVIISKGYAPYFLMMTDLVNWCNQSGIITNTRGSAAGSLVSYCLGITGIDPIKYELPFERFLNPMRPSPPDIDLDVADDRREEVISYITLKYGRDKVAQICTFGRMLARAAVRDVGRVLGHPYAFPDKIAKLIPLGSQGFPMTVKKALDISPELKVLYDTDPEAKKVLDLAQQIEGNARHVSVHAAGIVVSPQNMTGYTPLQFEPNGNKIITQYEFHTCEDIGLVKFDILGIRHLSILNAAREIIRSSRNTEIDLEHLPHPDKKTFAMLSRGETMGVFQLGSSGMTKWLKELKPNRIEDLIAMIMLFRPGPMAIIPEYIARKHGLKPATPVHPKMAKILEKSYGLLVYQEDIMFAGLTLAGYNWETVDALRKAIGKKLPKEMAKQHDIFVQGCMTHSGLTEAEAEKIWELFVPFQGYGFNKAHAASYGVVSYQTAYLKAHFPVEYMTALLTAESGNTEKIVEAIAECRRMGITVLPPHINLSHVGFTIEPLESSLDGRAIRFGLSAIKNVGEVAIKSILSARQEGQFTSLTDFCHRVDTQKVNRKVLDSLVKAGALDAFGKRSAMLAALDKIRQSGASLSKAKSTGQNSLFVEEKIDTQDQLPDIAEFAKEQKLELEKQLLGFYLTEHPAQDQLRLLQDQISTSISHLNSENYSGQTVTTGGVVESIRQVITKSGGQPMCFAVISDLVKTAEAVVFPKIYAQTTACWQPGQVVLLTGVVEAKTVTEEAIEDQPLPQAVTLIVNSASVLNDQAPRTISINIPKGTPQSNSSL